MFDFGLLKDIDIFDKIDDTKDSFNKEEADVIIRFFIELLMESMIELSEELGQNMSDALKTVLKDCLDVAIKSYIETGECYSAYLRPRRKRRNTVICGWPHPGDALLYQAD